MALLNHILGIHHLLIYMYIVYIHYKKITIFLFFVFLLIRTRLTVFSEVRRGSIGEDSVHSASSFGCYHLNIKEWNLSKLRSRAA